MRAVALRACHHLIAENSVLKGFYLQIKLSKMADGKGGRSTHRDQRRLIFFVSLKGCSRPGYGLYDVSQKANGGLTATELAWIQTMLSCTCGKVLVHTVV